MSTAGLPGRSAFADRGHLRRLVPGINPSAAVPRDEMQAPAKPVDVIRHATADVGSIPTVSIKSSPSEGEHMIASSSPGSNTMHWLAGLIEAEGTILRPPPSAPNVPRLAVRMTDHDVVARVAELFGVAVVRAGKGPHKTEFGAVLRGRPAAGLMRELMPLLGARRQAAAVEAIRAHHPSQPKLAPVQIARIQHRARLRQSVSGMAQAYRVSRPTIRAATTPDLPSASVPWRQAPAVPEIEALGIDGIPSG